MTEPSEHIIQRESVQWIRQYTPYLVYAIPNGGKRGRLEAMRLQAEGVTAGMPDLHLPELRLWIEMKTPTGTVSPVQKAMHERLRAGGQTVVVCRSVDHLVDEVTLQMGVLFDAAPKRQPLKKVSKK